jgi:hypothetical protein
VSYGLVITVEASAVVAEMDEVTHDLFVMAMLDLPVDPHGMGSLMRSEGAFTTRGLPLGPHGLIVYVVNETAATVTITSVLWLG